MNNLDNSEKRHPPTYDSFYSPFGSALNNKAVVFATAGTFNLKGKDNHSF